MADACALDGIDRTLLRRLQQGIPVCDRPFADVAAEAGIDETIVLERIEAMLSSGLLTRFGPMFDAERLGGSFTLCAMRVPPERVEEVAALVNGYPETAHNYEREHALNLWFVLGADCAVRIREVIVDIERRSGLTVLDLPKEEEFFVGLQLEPQSAGADDDEPAGNEPPYRRAWRLDTARPRAPQGRKQDVAGEPAMDATSRRIVLATQAGLPLCLQPYHELADTLQLPVDEVMQRLRRLLECHAIRRIAAVPNHYRLGYRANGMTVWDVDDDALSALGRQVGELPFVSHCYRRPRRPSVWRYNLFAMVHGADRSEVAAKTAHIALLLGATVRAHETLYSTRILKKTGLRLA